MRAVLVFSFPPQAHLVVHVIAWLYPAQPSIALNSIYDITPYQRLAFIVVSF